MGQHSPEYLNKYVQDVINSLNISKIDTICDIGCGLGFHVNILKQIYSDVKFIGIDFSKATVDYLKTQPIFHEIHLASAKTLPIRDNHCDIAISMENLEHLYCEDVMDALHELKRIGKYVIITTPVPHRVVNVPWLMGEIAEASLDAMPLNEHDYHCLESCVHKSVIFPESLLDAGFKQIQKYGSESECYYAETDTLDLSNIRFTGIHHASLLRNCDYKGKYIDLLNRSLALMGNAEMHA